MASKYIISRCISNVPFIACYVISISNTFQIVMSDAHQLAQIRNHNRDICSADIINGKAFSAFVFKWRVRQTAHPRPFPVGRATSRTNPARLDSLIIIYNLTKQGL